MAHISAVLHGSLTPDQIEWELSLARGYQLDAIYWLAKGVAVIPFVSIAKQPKKDKLR